MPLLKPAYLIHGDDHGAIAERRGRLRALAEGSEGGSASVETLEGEGATPAGLALALAAMTLPMGEGEGGAGRVIIVEGVERWREAEVEQHLLGPMAELAPQTTVALFAREDTRARATAKAPAAVHKAVKRAGGQIIAQLTVKPWELARWAREQAARLGISLDAAAAKALVEQVGARQQRLLRELEKLALEADGATITAEDIEARGARSAEWQAYELADALVGAAGPEATRLYLRLGEQGERLTGLLYSMASRMRDAVAASVRLQAGESQAEVKRSLRMPSRAADRLIRDVARSDPERLRAALTVLAYAELDSRGGAPLLAARTTTAALSEETIAVRAIEAITS